MPTAKKAAPKKEKPTKSVKEAIVKESPEPDPVPDPEPSPPAYQGHDRR